MLASRFPSGAIAVGTLGRVNPEQGFHVPLAQIVLDVGDAGGPFGIFGLCQRLTLRASNGFSGKRVWAQDLAGDSAQEITEQVRIDDRSLIFFLAAYS
jgi:hypothetical protein